MSDRRCKRAGKDALPTQALRAKVPPCRISRTCGTLSDRASGWP